MIFVISYVWFNIVAPRIIRPFTKTFVLKSWVVLKKIRFVLSSYRDQIRHYLIYAWKWFVSFTEFVKCICNYNYFYYCNKNRDSSFAFCVNLPRNTKTSVWKLKLNIFCRENYKATITAIFQNVYETWRYKKGEFWQRIQST